MKLNLLPATVSRGRATRTAWVVAALLGILSVLASAGMMITSGNSLNEAKSAYDEAKPAADRAVATSAEADTLLADDSVKALVRNVSLAQAMMTHNDDYPNLYNNLLRWVPP